MEKNKVVGELNPTSTPKKGELTKEEIMFKVDEDGAVMPEDVKVEIYDRALDDEIYMTTMELDNALTMHESTKKAFKQLEESNNKELAKTKLKIEELKKVNGPTEEQKKSLVVLNNQFDEREKGLRQIEMQNSAKLEAFRSKSEECRKDLNELEKMRDTTKEVRTIKGTPCTVAESNKYFNKAMWKNDKGEWIEPKTKEDMTYISYLLAEKVVSPKLSVDDWDKVLPNMRLSIREAIAEISFYKRPSPKEILVARRRSEKLKNIIGDSQ